MIDAGPWQRATISAGSSLTSEIDLGGPFNTICVLTESALAPSTKITLHVAWKSSGTFVPLYAMDTDQTGSAAMETTAGTAAQAIVFTPCGGVQYVKVSLSAGTTATATFYVRGSN